MKTVRQQLDKWRSVRKVAVFQHLNINNQDKSKTQQDIFYFFFRTHTAKLNKLTHKESLCTFPHDMVHWAQLLSAPLSLTLIPHVNQQWRIISGSYWLMTSCWIRTASFTLWQTETGPPLGCGRYRRKRNDCDRKKSVITVWDHHPSWKIGFLLPGPWAASPSGRHWDTVTHTARE